MTLLDLVTAMDVESNYAFAAKVVLQPDGTSLHATFCNCYVSTVTAALGCPIPPKLANKQHAWLKREGAKAGWVPCDQSAALHFALRGQPTVAVWTNPTGGPGHIALVVPAPNEADKDDIWVSSAGRHNHIACPLETSFGVSIDPEFFTHIKEPEC